MKASRKSINHHWDTQLPDCEPAIGPDYVVKQEAFSEGLKEIDRTLGLVHVEPVRCNRTSYPGDFEETDLPLSGMTTVEMLKRRYRLRPMNLLTEANRAIIDNFYSKDATFFGYADEKDS